MTAGFREAYAEHRAAEGRRYDRAAMLALPYLRHGPLARQWSVRARSYDALARLVGKVRPARVLDLGAGNGWLSYRLALSGISAVAIDVRDDTVDGLGAAACYDGRFDRVSASFDALPVRDRSCDMVIFNAALHYALDLGAVLAEARRTVRPRGRIVVLDSPFYTRERDGEAMLREKKASGAYTAALLAPPFIEYLTLDRLAVASPGLAWRRHRVRYPLWYELRPLMAWLGAKRQPSRFDLWECMVP